MNPDDVQTARDVINNYSHGELARVISKYGEERFAKRIATKILDARAKKTIETTFELVDIIKDAIPAAARRKGGHPAKKTFQAIRIEVNAEIDYLEDAIRSMVGLLNDKGHLCVISFHSLEDRVIKHTMREMENPCTCPSDAPICICGKKSMGKVITRKPVMAGEKELEENPRASSAKLRCFQRIIK
jgi:16S rRNA (cytosine1402-N4)-methyltransferase